jgi:hypothetical protein
MRFRYSTTDPAQTEFDSLPRVPLVLQNGASSIEALGLVDSGAMINILPYDCGLRLGLGWDDRQAVIPVTGSLGNLRAIPTAVVATIGDLAPIRLVFAWVRRNEVPLVLGQTNFFIEFDIHFYRSRLEFEIEPRG